MVIARDLACGGANTERERERATPGRGEGGRVVGMSRSDIGVRWAGTQRVTDLFILKICAVVET